MKNSGSVTRQGLPWTAKVIASPRIYSYKINWYVKNIIIFLLETAAAAPGANREDGMEFEGPQQQAPPGLGNLYIIFIVDF